MSLTPSPALGDSKNISIPPISCFPYPKWDGWKDVPAPCKPRGRTGVSQEPHVGERIGRGQKVVVETEFLISLHALACLQSLFSKLSSTFMLLSQSAAETGSGIRISEAYPSSAFRRILLTVPLCAVSESPGLITALIFSVGRRFSHLPMKSCHFETLV